MQLMSKVKKTAAKVNFSQPFIYRGIEIRPTALTRSAKTREIYEAMLALKKPMHAS